MDFESIASRPDWLGVDCAMPSLLTQSFSLAGIMCARFGICVASWATEDIALPYGGDC